MWSKNASRQKKAGSVFYVQSVCIVTPGRGLCKWFLRGRQFKDCGAIDKEYHRVLRFYPRSYFTGAYASKRQCDICAFFVQKLNIFHGIYTRLEKTEGPFVDLDGYIDSYEKGGANVRNVDWHYKDSDISDLKRVCFDYIRARYEGKEFRDIAKTGKDGSIFFFKDLWTAFLEEHQTNTPVDEETVEELRQKYPAEDLSVLLRRRDNDWVERAKGHLKGNLQKNTRKLEDRRDAGKPADLIERALGALQAVDCEQESFGSDPHIRDMIIEIDIKTGDRYVGSTYGYDGLLGRWSVYAVTGGHGNNKGMIEHFNAQKHSCHDLQFSVLQVLSKAMSKEQIIDAETLWKKKLLTYEPFGMNKS